MLRNILLSAVLAITALTSFSASAGTASADPPRQNQGRDHRNDRDRRHSFEVLYQHRNHWDSYGTYRDRDDAERAAWRLRRQGYQVRIEVEHNHR
jgi:hypothetical protein